jgi:antitoxin HicB
MAHELAYPVILTPDEIDGGFVVTFTDVPEAITQGETVPEALVQAADALEEAIAGRIRRGDPIPEPSTAGDRPRVPVPAQTAAKAALYLALRETGISKPELAARLELLDPRHSSKLRRKYACGQPSK